MTKKKIDMKAVARIDKEIADHPERFDYADVPNNAFGPNREAFAEAMKQAEKRWPEWVKKMIAKAQASR